MDSLSEKKVDTYKAMEISYNQTVTLTNFLILQNKNLHHKLFNGVMYMMNAENKDALHAVEEVILKRATWGHIDYICEIIRMNHKKFESFLAEHYKYPWLKRLYVTTP